MRRARRKLKLSKYKFLYLQVAVIFLACGGYVILNAPALIVFIHNAKTFALLKTFLGIFIAYVTGPLIVIYLVRRAIHEHKGITVVNWRTYLNDSLYNDFCAQPSDIDPNDQDYWITQEIIARKRAEQGGGLDYAVNGKALDPDTVVSIMNGTANHEIKDALIPEGDPLECLPEYDPNGPNPFG